MEVLVVKFEYRDNEEKIFWLLCVTVCVDYLDYKQTFILGNMTDYEIFVLLFNLD